MTERDPSFQFSDSSKRVLVWDFPTRAFHWLLVSLMVVSIVTIKIGGNAMKFHIWSGYAILALIAFRIVWGLVGSYYSRFWTFTFGPGAVIDYIKGKTQYLGHNPLGAGSVFALIGAVLFQAVSGLFANDDIATEGPLVKLITKELSDKITGWHKFNEKIIYALVALHVIAILFYLIKKKQNLIVPMITGYKTVQERVTEYEPVSTVLAALILAACGGGVWYLVNFVK